MKKAILAGLAVLALTATALAQSQTVRQSGNVTQRHAACWTATGVIQDCGSAAIPFLNTLGVLGEGPRICQSSDVNTAAGYQQICMGATTAGGGFISVQNYGTAAAQGLTFNVNGVPQSLVTATGPFTANGVACFSNTSGNLIDCGMDVVNGTVTAGVWQGTPVGLAYGGTGATSASGARTALGLGTMALQNSNNVTITGGTVTGMPSPVANSDVATKQYVDATATGLLIQPQVRLATAAVLPNSPTYANGASGVGATLTAGGNAALTVDGTAAVLADRVLAKNQAAPAQNGCYTVTTVGDGSTPWVLTRCTDFDTNAEMLAGSYFFTTAGAANVGSAFVLSGTVATVGTTAANFYTFSSAQVAVTSIDAQTGAFTCDANNMDCSTGVLRSLGGSSANVIKYGAVGDSNGSTGNGANDTAAIQAAFDQAVTVVPAVGGAQYRTIYFPCGTYRIEDTIVGNDAETQYRIYGEGQCSKIYNDAPSGRPTFSFSSSGCGGNNTLPPCIVIENLFFIAPTVPIGSIAINFVSNVYTRVANNVIRGYGTGIKYVTSYGPKIYNNLFLSIRGAGVDCSTDPSCNNAVIQGNNFQAVGVINGEAALKIGPAAGTTCAESATNVLISGNDISSGYIGVVMSGACSVVMEGNYFESNTGAPFYFGTGFNASIDIRGNWMHGNPTPTTSDITNVTGVRFENNSLKDITLVRSLSVSAWTPGYNYLQGASAIPSYCSPTANCAYMNAGQLMQWGTSTTAVGTPGTVAVTFPLACPNTFLSATATVLENSDISAQISSTSTTGITIRTSVGPATVSWQATCR